MIPIVHARCMRIVFHMTERPRWGDVLEPEKVRLLDGSTPTYASRVICPSCENELPASELFPLMGWLGGEP